MILWREEHRKKDIYPPIDVQFEANWVRKRPKVFVVSGTMKLIAKADYLQFDPNYKQDWVDGARIDITLEDIDYKQPTLKEFSWDDTADAVLKEYQSAIKKTGRTRS